MRELVVPLRDTDPVNEPGLPMGNYAQPRSDTGHRLEIPVPVVSIPGFMLKNLLHMWTDPSHM